MRYDCNNVDTMADSGTADKASLSKHPQSPTHDLWAGFMKKPMCASVSTFWGLLH